MYPHERSLVKRLSDRPFAIVGVNSDRTVERLKQVIEKEKMTWRSWYDGPGGPIAMRWNVHGYPTIFVLDGKGIIRFKGVRGQELDRAVDKLLSEMSPAPSRR